MNLRVSWGSQTSLKCQVHCLNCSRKREAHGVLRPYTRGICPIRKVREGFFEKVALKLSSAGRVDGQQLKEKCPMPKEQHTEDQVTEGAWWVWGITGQSGKKLGEGAWDGAAGDRGLVERLQRVFTLLRTMKDHRRINRETLGKWAGVEFDTICILERSLFRERFLSDSCFQTLIAYFLINRTQENDSHVLIKYCDSNTLFSFKKKKKPPFSHLMPSLLISIAHMVPQCRRFEQSLLCHPLSLPWIAPSSN